MPKPQPPMTRRRFLHQIGVVGGPAVLSQSMAAMGILTSTSNAWAGPPRLQADSGRGRSVLILGAGVAGLTAAFELRRAGYNCHILEAQHRIGGRNLTARRGTRITEERSSQVCSFDTGLYANMGPARFPHHHRRVLHYCRELNIPLEVFVMSSAANLLQTGSLPSEAVVRRRVQYDIQGHVAELLSKASSGGFLDRELSPEDRGLLEELLSKFGDLVRGQYIGSTRTGCKSGPDIFQNCDRPTPLDLSDLLSQRYWEQSLYAPDKYEWQSTMFQPQGGMDQIVEGFRRQLECHIQRCAEVQEIEIREDGVSVCYRDRRRNQRCRRTADYCISTIPVPILRRLSANFQSDFAEAMDACDFRPTCKVAWQANDRFWENDLNQIYGGISYVDDLIREVWYPSNNFHTSRGALIGAYNYGEQARTMGAMDLQSRLVAARAGGARLHEEFGDHRILPQQKGLSIAWQNVPYQEGGWAAWSCSESLSAMLSPDRRLFVAGDQVSTLPGWQEGAMMSAQHVVEQIAGLRSKRRQRLERLPDVQRLVEGVF